MYQITAIAFDCEIASAEAETFSYALEQILDELSSVWHDVDSTELLMLNPEGMRIISPLSLYI
jgi:hypothetical protein